MTATMETYGRTLCWTKRNIPPNTGGVFAVGAKEHDPEHRRGVCCRGKLTDYNVADSKGLRGVPLGVVMACSGPSGVPLVVTVPSNRCPRTVPSNTGRGNRIPGPRDSYSLILSRSWYLLETIEARLRGGGVASVFARRFVVFGAGVDCTDSRVHGKRRAVVC